MHGLQDGYAVCVLRVRAGFKCCGYVVGKGVTACVGCAYNGRGDSKKDMAQELKLPPLDAKAPAQVAASHYVVSPHAATAAATKVGTPVTRSSPKSCVEAL
jgi:hypothetical protein